MNKKIIISIITGATLFFNAGCKKFLDVNTDPAGAEKVNDGLLLSGVQMTDAFNIAGGYPAITAAFWTQQLGYGSRGPDWDSYKVTASDLENTWAYDLYPACLKNLKVLEAQAAESGHTHFEGVAKVMIAYNLAIATDLWNDVPYSDGFKGFDNLTPKYDSQEAIYTTIGTLLDDAIKLMNGADNSIVQPDAKDLVYQGKMSSWVQFAYFLKARYALRLVYAPGHTVAAQTQAALDAAALAFPDESVNAGVKFADVSGSQSPWYQFVNFWGQVYVSSTMIARLQNSNDPRLSVMADQNADGEYVGRIIGGPTQGDATLSYPGSSLTAPDGTISFGTYDELLFIKAEATFLKSGFAAAQPILVDAVKATMKRFGLDPASTEVADYIAANCQLTAANAYETIMNEKYISNYLSIESFNDWRRTNFPKLNVVQNPYLGLTTIPRRFVYPASENETNKQPQQPGNYTDRVWWDTKQ